MNALMTIVVDWGGLLILACLVLTAIAALAKHKPWAWATVRDTGVHRYQVHPDGSRRIIRMGTGYQPTDRQWLETGEWRGWRP